MARSAKRVVTSDVGIEGEIKVAPVKKSFKNTDRILCHSVLAGRTHLIGKRTREIYTFLGKGDKIEIEYQDLVAEVRERTRILFYPMIIVDDEDFVAEFNTLSDFYKTLYPISDIKQILQRPINEIKQIIPQLPAGIEDSLKAIASEMVRSGELDSVSVIKGLDEIWGIDLNLLIGFSDSEE